ncbi:MAG: hypothetical protein R8P61_30415 [Bacteroidia bacterium]|nr:hypothetical protein [Bacteroidia bacterium]
MKQFFLFLLCLSALSPAFSQVAYEQRLEIELKDGFTNEQILPLGDKGFLMRSHSEKKENFEKEWRYEFFDANMKSQGFQRLQLNKKYIIRDSYTLDHINYSLFLHKKTGDYTLLSLDTETREKHQIEGKLGRKHWVKDMKIMGDYAFMSASGQKRAYIHVRHLQTEDSKFIPIQIAGIAQKRIRIESLQLMEESKEVFVYIQAQINKKTADTYMLKLDERGEKKSLIKLSESSGRMLKGASASRTEKGELILTGTYARKYGSESEGLFIASYEEDEENFIRFYKFDELENFFNYLSPKKLAKRERKKERKAARGKELKSLYRIASHQIRELEDGFLFLGEAYYPTYRTECETTTSVCPDGTTTTTTTTETVFDGFQYTHAVLAKFSFDGELNWDRSFKMWPSSKPFTVTRFINVDESNDQAINMVFASNNEIISKSLLYENGLELRDKHSEQILTAYEGDQTKRSHSSLNYWYDNYYLAFGTQKIKNKVDPEVQRKRRVFFINKVAY